MSGASDGDVLRMWERGVGRSPPERALALLAAADPLATWDELSALPLCHRDRMLLELRRRLLGDPVRARHACAGCGSAIELATTVSALLDASAETVEASTQFHLDDCAVRVRLPTTLDMMLVVEHWADARTALLELCVSYDPPSDEPWRAAAVSDASRATLLDAIELRSGAAALQLAVTCAGCGARAIAEFDIVSFLWQEIAAEARRLAREVVALARAFAWREADVLALAPQRRRLYLELAES